MDQPDLELVAQLSARTTDARAEALGALIARGMAAVPALREALQNPDARVRAYAAEALGRIGDTLVADTLFAALHDADGAVRAQAAGALARLHDPRAYEALILTLGDLPDLLHGDMSLSAYALIGMGAPVLPRLALLLKDPDPAMRGTVFRIIAQIISRLPDQQGRWPELWQSLGSYDPNAAPTDRDRAAEALGAWSTKRIEEPPGGITPHQAGAQPDHA